MTLTTSQTGIYLIKSFEGCVLKAYQDSVNIWTIGYGHTKNVSAGMIITVSQAESFLKSDLTTMEKSINTSVIVPLTQNMFDSLVSFTFNVGTGALKRSKLLGILNQGDIAGTAKEFDKWVFAGNKILPGLVKRRTAEKELFLNGKDIFIISSNHSAILNFQMWLNATYNMKLAENGCYETQTKTATIKAYQIVLGVKADGIFGSDSKKNVITLKTGCTGNAVHILQGTLYCLGYNPDKMDGIFTSETSKAVKAFQSSKGLSSDGLAGSNTMYALFHS